MALAVALPVAVISGAGGTGTSASFTPSTGDLLVVALCTDSVLTTAVTHTLSDTAGGTWTQHAHADFASVAKSGAASMWSRPVPSGTSMTVTAAGGPDVVRAQVFRVSGQAASPIGASNVGASSTDPDTVAALTSTQANSVLFVAATDWNQTGSPTSSDLTFVGFDAASFISGGFGYKVLGPAGAQTANLNWGGTPEGTWAALEIKELAGVADIPYVARQAAALRPARDPAWAQQPRDATRVATAANPNTVPTSAPRVLVVRDIGETWWSQARRTPDPNLLSPAAPFDPVLAGTRTARAMPATHVDRRQVPQQRTYPATPDPVVLVGTGALGIWWSDDPAVAYMAARARQSDPSLLAPAAGTPLDPTLTAAGPQLAARMPVTHADRRTQVVQRRTAAAPDTVELVGTGALGAWWSEDTEPHQIAALRPRVSDPTMLVETAAPFDPLLAGTVPTAAGRIPATHSSRRQAGQQRTATAPVDVVALIGTGQLGIWWSDDSTAHFGPAQRTRLLDLSLLPSAPTGPADPLLLAAVPASTARLVPATHRDRRLVPAQRTAIAAPDDVVIVGTGAMVAWWGEDPTVAYQAAYRPGRDPSLLTPVVPPPDADPTLLGWLPGWITYGLAATHDDRRLVPQQPLRISEPGTYPAVPPTDPLLLAYGAGGPYWHLYNRAADLVDRRLVPAQRAYVSDPRLLGTALLEDPLLLAGGTGGDTWRRRNTTATHAPRWVLRTWRQALEFMGVEPTGPVIGYPYPGAGITVYAGPGAGFGPIALPGRGTTGAAEGG